MRITDKNIILGNTYKTITGELFKYINRDKRTKTNTFIRLKDDYEIKCHDISIKSYNFKEN